MKFPTVKHNEPTYFYIHYGKAESTASTAAAVWAGNNYVVVNHLNDTPTSANNDVEMIGSIAGVNDDFGTGKSDMGSDNVVDGKISKALELNKGDADGQFVCLDTEGLTSYHTCNGDSDIFSGTDIGTFWKDDDQGAVRSTSIWYNAVTTDNGTFQVIFEEGR